MAKNDYIRDSIKEAISTYRSFMILATSLICGACGYGIINIRNMKDLEINLGIGGIVILAVCLAFCVSKSLDLHYRLENLEHD